VPSPNWTAVERYFGREYVLRTPRLLDNSVFDFLSPPYSSGIGSSSAKSRFPRSPGNEAERYLGWDQHLSPRLSPRFPIPEKPEDLSNGSNSRGGNSSERKPGDPPPYAEAAEDLSTKRPQKENQAEVNNRMSSSPNTGDSDSNGGGPASNISSVSPVTPPSPQILIVMVGDQHLISLPYRQSPLLLHKHIRIIAFLYLNNIHLLTQVGNPLQVLLMAYKIYFQRQTFILSLPA